jgi:hypothetical protein
MRTGVAPPSSRVTSLVDVASPHSRRWPAQFEQLAPNDGGGSGLDDRILVRQARARLGQQGCEFSLGPERRQVEALGVQLFQPVNIPLKIELADAVVRDRQFPRAGIGHKVQILTLHRDQLTTVGLDDTQREVQALRLFDGLVAGDDASMPVNENGAAGTVLAQRALERGAAPVGAAISIVGIGREISKVKPMTVGTRGSRHDRRLPGAIAP